MFDSRLQQNQDFFPEFNFSPEVQEFLAEANKLIGSVGCRMSLSRSTLPGENAGDRYYEALQDQESGGDFYGRSYCIRLDNRWFEVSIHGIDEADCSVEACRRSLTILGFEGLREDAERSDDPGVYASYNLFNASRSLGLNLQSAPK